MESAMNASSVASDLEPMILCQRTGGTVFLTLNRPAQYNALSEQMLAALHAAFESIAADPSARVVVLSCAGKAVCAGRDLKHVKGNRILEYDQRRVYDCN